MDIDATYPALSALARSQVRPVTLRELGGPGRNGKTIGALPGLPTLADCCRAALADAPRRGDCDAYGYLATLDAYVRKLPVDSPARLTTWSRINSDGRAFLDAVAGAAWLLQLWNIDLFALPDEPFPAPSADTADVMMSLDGVPYWLDTLGVDFAPDGFYGLSGNGRAAPPPPERRELLSDLSGLVLSRYDRKFRRAVSSGPLAGQSVGVLVCLARAEDAVVRQLIAAPPPPELFGQDTPGLDLVWVHNLHASQRSDVLEPVTILEWMRPKVR